MCTSGCVSKAKEAEQHVITEFSLAVFLNRMPALQSWLPSCKGWFTNQRTLILDSAALFSRYSVPIWHVRTNIVIGNLFTARLFCVYIPDENFSLLTFSNVTTPSNCGEAESSVIYLQTSGEETKYLQRTIGTALVLVHRKHVVLEYWWTAPLCLGYSEHFYLR